jgi:ribose transport system substrate-binding protein
MKKFIRILSLLLTLCLLASLTACDANGSKTSETPSKKVVIGYSTIAYTLSALTMHLYDDLESACQDRGWEFLALSAEGDVAKQSEQARQLIQQKPDVIILLPSDPNISVDLVKEMYDAEIPCITLHTDVAEEGRQYVSAFCGPDNYTMAASVAMAIIDDYGPDSGINIVQIGGVPVQADSILRIAGFNDTINANSNFNILGLEWAYSSRADAQGYMENFISAYGDQIDVFVGFNDDLTLGGVNALSAAGMTDVGVYSTIAYNEGITAVKDGKMRLTALYSPAEAVADAVSCVEMILAGETISEYNHYTNIPLITSANADQYESEF